jgi:hypothetical protein
LRLYPFCGTMRYVEGATFITAKSAKVFSIPLQNRVGLNRLCALSALCGIKRFITEARGL